MIFALLALPIMMMIGFGIDYGRVVLAKTRLQDHLDSAVLASVVNFNNKTDTQIQTALTSWMSAAATDVGASLQTVTISRSGYTVNASATATVQLYFGALFSTTSWTIGANSSAYGPSSQYMNVYLVLDSSASMQLASDTADQATMRSAISCEFACHTGDTHVVNGVTYSNNAAYASAMGISTRFDVMKSAASSVLNLIDSADPSHNRIQVGVYYFNTTLQTAQTLTYTTSSARTALGSTWQATTDGTWFDVVLPLVNTLVGSSGDGSSSSSPLKIVIMVTDGVDSQRSWVTASSWTCQAWSGSTCTKYPMASVASYVTPLSPSLCSTLKSNGATLAVLYTTYLSIPLDWGYNGTVGAYMPSSWSGTLDSGYSYSGTTRQSYIPVALKDCATSGYYMSADTTSTITTNLQTLFQQYLQKVRLVKPSS